MTSNKTRWYIITGALGLLLVGGGLWLKTTSYEEVNFSDSEVDGDKVPTFQELDEPERREDAEVVRDEATTTRPEDAREIPPGMTMEQWSRLRSARAYEARNAVRPLSSEEVMEVLLEASRSKDQWNYTASKNELLERGRRGDANTVRIIQSTIPVVSTNRQQTLVFMLGEIANEEAIRALVEIVETYDEDDEIQGMVLEVMRKIGDYYVLNQQQGDPQIPKQRISGLLKEYHRTIPITNVFLRRAVKDSIRTLAEFKY